MPSRSSSVSGWPKMNRSLVGFGFLCVLLLSVTAACARSPDALEQPTAAAELTLLTPSLGCGPRLKSAIPAIPQLGEPLRGAELWYDSDVNASDRAGVAAGLAAVETYITSDLGAGLPPLVCFDIRAANEGPVGSAETAGAQILILTTPEGWPQTPAWRLQQVAAHEYIHAWQAQVAGTSSETSPVWLLEGMADWVALHALIQTGKVTPAEVYAAQLTPTGPLVPPLEDLETPTGWMSTLQPYSLAYEAVDLLISDKDPGLLRLYLIDLSAGMTWQSAFHQAFGIQPADFYRSFDGLQAALQDWNRTF